MRAHRLDEFAEEADAVRILDVANVLADQILGEGVHDHARLHVIDPEVAAFVVALRLDGGQRRLLGRFLGHDPLVRLRIEIVDGAVGGLDEMLRLLLAPFQHRVLVDDHGGSGDADQGRHAEENENGHFVG